MKRRRQTVNSCDIPWGKEVESCTVVPSLTTTRRLNVHSISPLRAKAVGLPLQRKGKYSMKQYDDRVVLDPDKSLVSAHDKLV